MKCTVCWICSSTIPTSTLIIIILSNWLLEVFKSLASSGMSYFAPCSYPQYLPFLLWNIRKGQIAPIDTLYKNKHFFLICSRNPLFHHSTRGILFHRTFQCLRVWKITGVLFSFEDTLREVWEKKFESTAWPWNSGIPCMQFEQKCFRCLFQSESSVICAPWKYWYLNGNTIIRLETQIRSSCFLRVYFMRIISCPCFDLYVSWTTECSLCKIGISHNYKISED